MPAKLNKTVRAEGAVPATIGVIGGVAKVGLEDSELEFMATAEGLPKLSARDLPSAVAKASDGATTVAATSLRWRGSGSLPPALSTLGDERS